MIIVFFDVECTAWEGSLQRRWSEPWEFQEIVQIGATKVKVPPDGAGDDASDDFVRTVRPERNPLLSDYFVRLTGISQDDVDRDGVTLADAVRGFLEFCASAGAVCSNGKDAGLVAADLRLRDLEVPDALKRMADIGPLLSRTLGDGSRHLTTSSLPGLLGITTYEPAHQGLGDARALAATVRALAARDPAFLDRLHGALAAVDGTPAG